jgi:GNAT superfamily N-acetyltransferase
MATPNFELAVCSPSDADDADLLAHLVAMVNAAYTRGEGLASEGGMWKGERVERINTAEACALLRARKLVLCRPTAAAADAAAAAADAAVPAPRLAGSVLCDVAFDAAARVGELGMLCVDATCLGQGVGRLLMREAEATCVAAGCVAIRLELLAPSEFQHPVKAWLDAWYQREGYAVGDCEDFASAYPRIAPLLVPCVFTTYRKELA